jgi:hypothetical protein
MTEQALKTAKLGQGTAIHLADTKVIAGQEITAILCNRWGSVNGQVKAPKLVLGVEATCQKCQKLAGQVQA